MKLEDVDKIAEAKRVLERIAELEQRVREARRLGLATASSAPSGADDPNEDLVLIGPTNDEEFVEEVRAAVLHWCARRRRDLRATLEGFGVDVADA